MSKNWCENPQLIENCHCFIIYAHIYDQLSYIETGGCISADLLLGKPHKTNHLPQQDKPKSST